MAFFQRPTCGLCGWGVGSFFIDLPTTLQMLSDHFFTFYLLIAVIRNSPRRHLEFSAPIRWTRMAGAGATMLLVDRPALFPQRRASPGM